MRAFAQTRAMCPSNIKEISEKETLSRSPHDFLISGVENYF